MDLATSPKYYQPSALFLSNTKESSLEGKTGVFARSQESPFDADPLCELNLKETSEFVKSMPMANGNRGILDERYNSRGYLELPYPRRKDGANSVIQRRIEAPPTPGRPIFGFSVARKSFPSKWDDAEKWLVSSSCHESPAHAFKPSESLKGSKVKCCENFKQPMMDEEFAEKLRLTEEKVPKSVSLSSFQRPSFSVDHCNSAKAFNAVSASADVLLKDKFTDEVDPIVPKFRYSVPSKEVFLFGNSAAETLKDASTDVMNDVQHRDVGTEMTPIGSVTTSRCHTPFKIASPARHNTPANRSGPLASGNSTSTDSTINISQLQECHIAKLQQGTQYDSVTSNWSSREEEEEDISKSLRHYETGIGRQKSVSETRAAAWEEDEQTKCCLRYQREEAKIQAWVNLQTAKAEAQTKKLEVKIQRMRSNLEEKLMKRMASVHKKAEDWRVAAQRQHSEQMKKASEQAQKMITRPNAHFSGHSSCGCFPCNNLH